MSFRFPPSFEKNHPEAMKNLRTNGQRLSTPFDIHATLRDIVDYSAVLRGDVKQVRISRLGNGLVRDVTKAYALTYARTNLCNETQRICLLEYHNLMSDC